MKCCGVAIDAQQDLLVAEYESLGSQFFDVLFASWFGSTWSPLKMYTKHSPSQFVKNLEREGDEKAGWQSWAIAEAVRRLTGLQFGR
jgi:hypothetical protein